MTQPRQVVVDPNVYVSAALTPSGACGRLVEWIDDSAIVAISCPHLITELRHALLHPKLRRYVSAEGAIAYCDTVRVRTERHADPVNVPAETRDPKDDYLVALAVEAAADAIISGDPDLLTAELPVTVWAPRTALQMLTVE